MNLIRETEKQDKVITCGGEACALTARMLNRVLKRI